MLIVVTFMAMMLAVWGRNVVSLAFASGLKMPVQRENVDVLTVSRTF